MPGAGDRRRHQYTPHPSDAQVFPFVKLCHQRTLKLGRLISISARLSRFSTSWRAWCVCYPVFICYYGARASNILYLPHPRSTIKRHQTQHTTTRFANRRLFSMGPTPLCVFGRQSEHLVTINRYRHTGFSRIPWFCLIFAFPAYEWFVSGLFCTAMSFIIFVPLAPLQRLFSAAPHLRSIKTRYFVPLSPPP